MIVDPSGRRVSSNPAEQATSDAFFGLNRELGAAVFGDCLGTILDVYGKPMNRVAPKWGPLGGLATWLPSSEAHGIQLDGAAKVE